MSLRLPRKKQADDAAREERLMQAMAVKQEESAKRCGVAACCLRRCEDVVRHYQDSDSRPIYLVIMFLWISD